MSPASRPPSPPPRPTLPSYIAAEKTAEANVEHAKADLEQKRLDWERAQALYKAGIMAKQDYDAKKAAYDIDVATLAQAVGAAQPGQGADRFRARAPADAGGHPALQPGPARPDHRHRSL